MPRAKASGKRAPSARRAASEAGAKAPKGAPQPARRKAGRPAHKTVPKADGDAAVQAFIGLLPGWQSEVARRVDRIVTQEVPGVVKAIKWHSAMYGSPGKGWFASMAGFKAYVKVNFFDGTSLNPVPPSGAAKKMRAVDIASLDGLDEKQMAVWVRQAAALPGWATAR